DVSVVGRVDEDLEIDGLAVAGQVIRNRLAGLQAAIVDRRADPQRAEVCGLEHELAARLPAGDDRRDLERGEPTFLPRGLPDLEADVVTREQGAEAGDPAQRDARFDD